jgi:hypothetical protein
LLFLFVAIAAFLSHLFPVTTNMSGCMRKLWTTVRYFSVGAGADQKQSLKNDVVGATIDDYNKLYDEDDASKGESAAMKKKRNNNYEKLVNA